MTTSDDDVRLVLLGGTDAAPVCEGDACYLPNSTVDSAVALTAGESGDEGADGEDA